MKKNLTVTLGGRSFVIDEDAYQALDAYINGIKSHYAADDPEGEIASDFESRIADLFAEETEALGFEGATVSLQMVRRAIERVGSLDSLIREEGIAEEEPVGNDRERSRQGGASEIPTPPPPPSSSHQDQGPRPRHIYYRSDMDCWIGGVLGGLGEYLGMEAMLFRLTFILLLFTPVMPGLVLVYLAMMIFVPKARTITQRLELHGIPVSPTTIWRGIDAEMTQGEATEEERKSAGKCPLHLSDFLSPKAQRTVGWTAAGLLLLGITLAMIALFVAIVEGNLFSPDYFSYFDVFSATTSGVLFIIAGCLVAIPLVALLLYLLVILPLGMILRSKRSSTTVKVVSILLWIAIITSLAYIIF